MAKILVLGGAGFIGSHLVERLLSAGNEVHVIDSMKFCYGSNLYDAGMNYPDTFSLSQLSLLDDDFSLASVAIYYDEIYHLAGIASTEDFQDYPVDSFMVSLTPMMQLLEMKRMPAYKDIKVLFASSSEVYGRSISPTQHEYDWGHVNFTGVRSGYDEGKRSAEALIAGYKRQYGIECKVARLFNTYGPRMRHNGRVIPAMIANAIDEGEVLIHGNGAQTRSFLYVDDCVDALIKLMDLVDYCPPINIGSTAEIGMGSLASKIVEILEEVCDLTGIQLEHHAMREDDVLNRCPDISAAKDILDFSPTIDLDEGLRRTVKYFFFDEGSYELSRARIIKMKETLKGTGVAPFDPHGHVPSKETLKKILDGMIDRANS